MEYEKLLTKLYKEVKPLEQSTERFEIPKITGHHEGTKTILTNFGEIVTTLRRPKEHILKFLLRELATPAKMDGNRLILNRKLSSKLINDKITRYANEFVICPDCKKPDTELIKEHRITFIHCLACGSKHSVRGEL
ncbi:translation initiation factor IF-2 subunit beta [Nanoarchaeota archaeon]